MPEQPQPHRLPQTMPEDGDPRFTEECFPVIYQHTGGVPRQINTLCSRLLLHGSLEELHTLQAAIVEKVAYDLRQEMAVVTLDPGSDIPRPEHNGHAEAMTEVTKRLSALEKRLSALAESVDRHERVIKRAIEIAGAFFQVEQQ